MTKIILYLLTLSSLLLACSDEVEKEKQAAATDNSLEIPSPRATRVIEHKREAIDYVQINPEISKYLISLDSVYSSTPFYIKLDQHFIFMVCQGEWQIQSDTLKKDKARFGLVDEKGTVLLAAEYNKIYNPDLTAHGYIEIEKNEKKGLYNYTLNAIVIPQFDVIFPSEDTEFSAIGKKGDQYFGIREAQVVPYTKTIPTYSAFSEKWKFDVKQHVIYWNDCYDVFAEDMREGTGYVFTPSYLQQLDFLPEVVAQIGAEKEIDFGIVQSKGSIVETHSLGKKVSALITLFYEEGVDARGWEIERNHITTVDENNNVIAKENFFQIPDMGRFYYCEKNSLGFHYLDNNMLEVRDISSSKSYDPYDCMTIYRYYKINSNGRIETLESNRIFDFTKYVEINASYFNGCLSKSIDDVVTINGEEGNMWLSDHLSIEDLDLMRNEIFAEYGMKFKSEKWKKYFENQKWYRPQYDNVDHLLSEIDKHNIKVILAEQARMKGKENQVTNRRLYMYAPAG